MRRSGVVLGLVALTIASLGFSGGVYLTTQQHADRERVASAPGNHTASAVIAETASRLDVPAGTVGQTLPAAGDADGRSRADADRREIVDAVKLELQREMGLMPLRLLRDRRDSFVELYTYDNNGASSYGTAGYLGDGYFITVKHGVVALGQSEGDASRRIESIKLIHGRRAVSATVVDAGDAEVEVDPGDWAILRADEPLDVRPLRVDLAYEFAFADPIVRLGNDYSKGVILATGNVGQHTPNGLVTCLTDGHPGVSGGGVLDRKGDLVGVPVGRMQGDYRFSFILPLRHEMFRRVPSVTFATAGTD